MATNKTCPSCGKSLAANAPAGLCPECLMQAGFPTGTEPQPAGAKHFHFRPPTVEELKPHFPQLEILNFIGQGGMGAVYKARQPMLDRYVALKILPPEAATGPGFTERFTREARALARLNHPNIVAVHEFGRSRRGNEAEGGQGEGYHYLIMEFVDGANLRDMERAQRLSPAQALSIVPKICEALQYAHDEGVVHRDIKPENILVDKKGRVKIADFGIAKILGAEQPHVPLTGVVGTPHYMAPEQVEKPQTVDHRADIYSVGVVFYEMLTGELPLGRFAAPSKKVQIDVRLDEVVLRALEKEPEQRYQQAGHVQTAVETISSTTPPERSEPAESSISDQPALRHRFAVRVITLLAAVVVISGLVYEFVITPFHPNDGRSGRLYVYKLARSFHVGDMVVYRWFATGYPEKFQVGRVIDIPRRGQITVQHRLEAPITIALSDVVGKVIGNTAPSSAKVDDSQWALFSPVSDPSLGDSSFRLINLLPPRFITLARFEVVDERDGTSMLIPELSFYFASGDEPSNVASRITWTLRNVPLNQGARIGQIKGEVGPQVFGNAVTLPTLPTKNSNAGIASWRAIQPTRSYWVAPGEWSQRQWNNMPLFEGLDTQGHIIGQMRVQLLVSPLDPQTKVLWTTPLFKIGDWKSNSELKPLLGANLPDSPLGHFAIGQRYFPKGDVIELTSIAQVGDRIVAKGRYKLISADRATLTFNVTSTEPHSAHTIVAPEQSAKISKGEGVFQLSNSASYSGFPHISMYNVDGRPFASVYFGTKDEADKESRLQLSHELRSLDLEQLPAVVVETIPASGSDDVAPGEMEIQVRFSKDMADDSWSWTTAWDHSNPDEIDHPHFTDPRTCALKVKLEPGRTYAYWLNSDKFENFKDSAGNPAIPYLLIFKTKTK